MNKGYEFMDSMNADVKKLRTGVEAGQRDDDYEYLSRVCLRYLTQYTKYALQNNVPERDAALNVLNFYRSFIE